MPEIAECIAFANYKGGTGKTTSCLSIGGFLAKGGSRVLLIDFDPQASTTSGIGIDKLTLKHSMYDAILSLCDGYEGVPLRKTILETDVENLHLAPAGSAWIPSGRSSEGFPIREWCATSSLKFPPP
jgi:chromosome partitioning protein